MYVDQVINIWVMLKQTEVKQKQQQHLVITPGWDDLELGVEIGDQHVER